MIKVLESIQKAKQTSEFELNRRVYLQVDRRLNLRSFQLVLSRYCDLVCPYHLGDETTNTQENHRRHNTLNYKQPFAQLNRNPRGFLKYCMGETKIMRPVTLKLSNILHSSERITFPGLAGVNASHFYAIVS